MAATSFCPRYHCRQDRATLGGEVHKRSSFASGDDDTSSQVSTEVGVDALRSLEPDSPAWPAPHENLVILDWDDTLFPTTWLREQGLLEKDALISAEQDVQLQALADLVAVTLEVVKRRGGVCIVTNAEQGWVELSCRAIMPSLRVHLDGVGIVSARTHHERHGVFAPALWKCLAFEEVVGEFYSAPDDIGVPQRRRNIVSVGDSEYEMEALKWIAADTECRAKTLKFVERPSLEQFIQQHELLASCVNDVIDHDGNFDLEVGVEDS